MTQKIQIRRDTANNWIAVNPILADGEIGFETDTKKLKVGNGIDIWNALDYISGGSSILDFLDLTDTPDTYGSNKGKVLMVNTAETGLEFGDLFYTENSTIIEGFEDTPIFTRTGTWTITTDYAMSGTCSLKGGGGTQNTSQTVDIILNVDTPGGNLEFDYAVCGNGSNDFKAYLDDVTLISYTTPTGGVSELNWVHFSTAITVGTHILRFYYYNDEGGTIPYAFVDNITIPASRTYHHNILDHNGIPNFVGHGGQFVKVNSTENSLEFVDAGNIDGGFPDSIYSD